MEFADIPSLTGTVDQAFVVALMKCFSTVTLL